MSSTPTRQALVVRGGWDGHQPVEATDLFLPFLREHGFEVRIEDSPPSTPTRSSWPPWTSSSSA